MFYNKEISGTLINETKVYSAELIQKEVKKIKLIYNSLELDGKEIVALALPRNIYLIAAILASLDSNIPFLPIDLDQPRERVLYMLDNAKVKYIFSVEEVKYNFGERNIIYMDDNKFTKNLSEKFITKYNNDIAYILYTSGTTGKPKAVEVTRKGFNNFIEAIPEIIEFKKEKRIACFTSASFDIFFLETVLPLYREMTVVLANKEEKDNPRSMIKILNEYAINAVQMTPSRLKMLKAVDVELESLKNIEIIMVGGEKFPYDILKDLQNNTSAKIYNMYGPTETTIWSIVSELTHKDKIDLGYPIRETAIYLLSDESNEVPQGTIGEICIGGSGLARGYLSNQEQTEKAFRRLPFAPYERIYHTGDIGIYDNDGDLIYIGRKDEQIKLRGHRIELEEIDSNITKIQEIKMAATCFDMDKEVLIAFFVSDNFIKDSGIRKYLQRYLPNYMIPSIFCRVEKLLYSISGKIDRKGLLKLYENMNKRDSPISGNAIDNEVQEKVIKVTREVLEDKSAFINTSSETVDLGLDSINFLQIIVELENIFNIEFDDDKLVFTEFDTVGSIIKYINESLGIEK